LFLLHISFFGAILERLKSFLITAIFILVLFIPFQKCSAQSPVPADAKLEKLKTGLKQAEGPVWIDSVGLLFSNIQANTICRYAPADSSLTTWMYPSDSSNGMTLDRQGRLILTQMAKRRVARREANGTITPLASTYNGKKFNSPNDIIVKSDGTIFFTDPDYNTPNGQAKELGFTGIYRVDTNGNVKLLDKTFTEPNGICLSLDETKLYVDDSPKQTIYVFDVISNDSIANKRQFYKLNISSYSVVDGMKFDSAGNIYCASPIGILVISPAGTILDTIVMSENPSNCAWGDADRKTLYITTFSSLYRIRLASTSTTGVSQKNPLQPQSMMLYPNYPNPFNPATQVRYSLPHGMNITLSVYDVLGRPITTLFNGFENTGLHELQWNADQYAAGIYFLRLQTDNAIQTQKMLLLK
jgi:gluconolactonase